MWRMTTQNAQHARKSFPQGAAEAGQGRGDADRTDLLADAGRRAALPQKAGCVGCHLGLLEMAVIGSARTART
jgi:hypothetical protein